MPVFVKGGVRTQKPQIRAIEGIPETVPNLAMKIDEKGILTIKVDLTKSIGNSQSGKSILIASAGRGINLPGQEHIKLNFNLYTANDGQEAQ